jgi:hypothetical protein
VTWCGRGQHCGPPPPRNSGRHRLCSKGSRVICRRCAGSKSHSVIATACSSPTTAARLPSLAAALLRATRSTLPRRRWCYVGGRVRWRWRSCFIGLPLQGPTGPLGDRRARLGNAELIGVNRGGRIEMTMSFFSSHHCWATIYLFNTCNQFIGF